MSSSANIKLSSRAAPRNTCSAEHRRQIFPHLSALCAHPNKQKPVPSRIHRRIFAAVIFAILLPTAARADAYVQGTLLAIHKKVQTTPISWLWNTVVTSYDTVRSDLRIWAGNQIYIAEYVPLIQGPLPTEWQTGRPISFRIEKRELVIKLSYGNEIRTNLLRRESAHSP